MMRQSQRMKGRMLNVSLKIRESITSIVVTSQPKEVESIILHVKFLVTVWRRKELQPSRWKKLPHAIVAERFSKKKRCLDVQGATTFSIVLKNVEL
mmetsp:Transcript_61773/g.69184  ORF Transcript_61773/g.69184 Transcript_61773/m.69184 type:complete len:96 (-) Transcript_61773:195-482(-)